MSFVDVLEIFAEAATYGREPIAADAMRIVRTFAFAGNRNSSHTPEARRRYRIKRAADPVRAFLNRAYNRAWRAAQMADPERKATLVAALRVRRKRWRKAQMADPEKHAALLVAQRIRQARRRAAKRAAKGLT